MADPVVTANAVTPPPPAPAVPPPSPSPPPAPPPAGSGESFTPMAPPPLGPGAAPPPDPRLTSSDYHRANVVDAPSDLTPADLYGVGGAYYGVDALARGIRSSNPFAQAIQGAFMYGEAAKFAPDPKYSPITDPAYAGRPDKLIPVLAARSKPEADFINRQIDFWRLEQQRLGNSGVAASIGEVVGMFLDPSAGVGLGNDLLGAARMAADTRLGMIRTQLLRHAAGALMLAVPTQAAASALDPLRPSGSMIDSLLTIAASAAVFGAVRGATMPKPEALAGHAAQNAAVDPLQTGGSLRLDVSTPEGFNRLWESVKQQETAGGTGVTAISTLPDGQPGAAGVGQVMPGTAREIAQQLGEADQLKGMTDDQVRTWLMQGHETGMTNSERYGRVYLQQQLDKYGDPTLALAAYNAGPGAVDRWLKEFGDPRTGKVTWQDWTNAIPYAETRNYVQEVHGRLGGERVDPIRNESVGATATSAPGEGGTLYDLANAAFFDKKGRQVSLPEKARTIRFPGATHSVDDVSLIDFEGNHVGGAPLAEGRPAVVHDAATLLDHAGNATADPTKAARVILPGESHAADRFVFHDPAGVRIEHPAGARFATLLDKGPAGPGLQARLAHMRVWLAEAVDWVVTTPLEVARPTQEGLLQPQSSAQAAGAAPTGTRIAPGATSYAGAQALHGEAMVGAFGLEKAPTNPILRLLNSGSLFARDIVTRLTQIGGMQVKNTWGVASRQSVWTRLGLLRGQMNQALRATDAAYVRYVERMMRGMGQAPLNAAQRWTTALRGRPGIMSKKQFYEAVGKAKRYGPGTGLPAEAEEAARIWDDKVYKPIVEKADQHGAFLEPLREKLMDLGERYKMNLLQGRLQAARQIRGEITQLTADLKSLQGKPTYKPDYLNRIYDQRALSARPDEFKAILRRYIPGLNPQGAQEILDTLQRAQPYQPFGPDQIGRASALHERTLAAVPDQALESFLEHDISIAGGAYVRQMGADALLAEEFGGDLNLNHALDGIVNDYHQLAQGASPAEQARLQRGLQADLRDVRALRDMVRGTYGLPKDPQAWMSRAIRFARNFNTATQLTGFISALPDMARVPMVHGVNQTIGGLLSAFSGEGKTFKLARDEARLAGESADVMTALNHGLFGHVSDSFAGTSKVEGIIQHIASARFAADGMAFFQDTLKSFTSLVAGTQMLKAAERLAAGQATADEIAKLAASHIDRPMAERIADQARTHGFDHGSVRLANSELWTDGMAQDAFRAGLNREINTTIAGSATPGERPLWMSSELGSLISQYRTYGFSAMQRILIPGLQQRDRQFLFGAAAMVGLGMMTDMLLSKARGENYDSKPWGLKLTRAVDRSGITGYIMDVNNTVEGLTFGQVGLQPALGLGGRGDAEHAASAGLGPTASTIGTLFKAIGGNPNDPRTQQAQMRLVPLYNIWQTRALFDLVAGENGQRGQGPPTQ